MVAAAGEWREVLVVAVRIAMESVQLVGWGVRRRTCCIVIVLQGSRRYKGNIPSGLVPALPWRIMSDTPDSWITKRHQQRCCNGSRESGGGRGE